jgi:rod shape-determining protein MreB
MICVPSLVSGAVRRSLTEAAIKAGARQAWLLDAPLAAAIGADLPIAERRGHAICDIGGGTTEIAVMSLSGVVAGRAVPVGGVRLDQSVAALLAQAHDLLIDERVAEDAKIRAGAVPPSSGPLPIHVSGRDLASGAPRTVAVEPAEVIEALHEPLSALVAGLREVLAQTPPDLVRDIESRGIVLTGGGALLRGLDRYLAARVGIWARVATDARACGARGAGLALDRFEVLRRGHLSLR